MTSGVWSLESGVAPAAPAASVAAATSERLPEPTTTSLPGTPHPPDSGLRTPDPGPPATPDSSPRSATTRHTTERLTRRIPTLLVVDDDRVLRRYLDLTLARGGHFVIEAAEDVAAALDILQGTLVDAVVTDLAMPGTDGLAFIRRLRRERRWRDLPVVVLTADTRLATRVAALRLGADDVLVKPCDVNELVARLDGVLRRAALARAAARHRRYCLAGDFTGFPFGDLVGHLAQGRRTGVLCVVTTRAGGEVLFERGDPVAARYGTVAGEDAVFRLLGERDGRFEFTPGELPADAPRTIDLPASALLMEGARRLDEEVHASGLHSAVSIGREPAIPASTGPAPAIRAALTALPADSLGAGSPHPAGADLALALEEDFRLGELEPHDGESLRQAALDEVPGARCHVLLVADLSGGLAALASLAAPVGEEALRRVIEAPPITWVLSFHLPGGSLVDVVLADADRLARLEPFLARRPAVVLVAPAGGDPLAFSVRARADLATLLAQLRPDLLLGCGNLAFAADLPGLGADAATRLLSQGGALGEPGTDLRALLVTALNAWGEGPGVLTDPAVRGPHG